jgi:signal peptidase I
MQFNQSKKGINLPRLKIFLTLVLLILFLILVGLLWLQPQKTIQPQENYAAKENSDGCVSKSENLEVRGDSLSPLINSGQTIKLLYGYYQCHPVEREDIVAYGYAGNDAPIIKIIKGLEGDKFQLKKSATGCGWNILINAEVVKNSQNVPYCLSEAGYRMLSLYEKDYKGVIPQNAYLILGNSTGGTLDSSRFGLVDKSDFLGKVQSKDLRSP